MGTVTVGRSSSCDISAVDPRLSREHAAFDVVGADVVVRDLESRNGTRVNGARIGEHRLEVGDTVEVGPFTMQLVETGSPPAAERGQRTRGDDEATVLLPPRAPRSGGAPGAASSELPSADATPPPPATSTRAGRCTPSGFATRGGVSGPGPAAAPRTRSRRAVRSQERTDVACTQRCASRWAGGRPRGVRGRGAARAGPGTDLRPRHTGVGGAGGAGLVSGGARAGLAAAG